MYMMNWFARNLKFETVSLYKQLFKLLSAVVLMAVSTTDCGRHQWRLPTPASTMI